MQSARADFLEDHEISAYLKRLMAEDNIGTVFDKTSRVVVRQRRCGKREEERGALRWQAGSSGWSTCWPGE
jgi:hypothetical protein